MPSPTNAPAPPPALVASAEGEPVTDLDHARYDRDGWMESALRAQGYVGELQGRLAAAESARDEAVAERDELRAELHEALHGEEAQGVLQGLKVMGGARDAAEAQLSAALARAERLEEALKPFADFVSTLERQVGDARPVAIGGCGRHRKMLTAGEVRRAAAALAHPAPVEEESP